MSMQDPIADLLTRIRNGQMASKVFVEVPYSKTKEQIVNVLREEGYVGGITTVGEGAAKVLKIPLRYFEGRPVIQELKRVSRPGLRVYKQKDKLPKIMGGLGVSVISTSQGVIADRKAREIGIGGEILCAVS